MPYQTIEVTKLTPHIGAEIGGVDLSRPLGNQQFQEVHDALMENLVIFFRDQHLTHDQHKDFGRLFGNLAVHPASPHAPEGHPEILTIHADENSKHVAGEEWHSDVSCDPTPPMGSILYLTEVPPAGGDTLFASMYQAYETLSPPIKVLIEGLTATHDGEPVYRGRFGYSGGDKGFPRAQHPVVRTHPVTGRKALFVNGNFTTRIDGLSKLESDALLRMLCCHAETPEFQCRFRWRENSVAFWDNRCVQHHAMWDYFPQRRHGYRVTVEGDRPFYRA
jgi:alpha-ketoglutarate-dependent taurine dioxygenase